MGGFLAFPSKQFPETFSQGNIFSTFPALLPIVVVAFGLVLCVMLTAFFLPRDLASHSRGKYFGQILYSFPHLFLISSSFYSAKNRKSLYFFLVSGYLLIFSTPGGRYWPEYLPLSHSDPSDEKEQLMEDPSEEREQLIDNEEQKSRNSCCCIGPRKILEAFTKECLITCFLYGMFSITDTAFIELLPIYLATSREYKGLGK